MIIVRDLHICPSVPDILDLPLWQGPSARSERLLTGVRFLLDMVEADNIIQARCVFGLFRIEQCNRGGIVVQGGERFEVDLTDRVLRSCTHLAVSLATIGPHCERRATQLIQNRERLHGLLLDTIGSAAVELAAERCRDLIAEKAAESALKAGPVLSPGSSGFCLGHQLRIHRMLDGEQIGVRLSSSGVLRPVKSLSSISPLGPTMPDCSRDHTCSRCEMSGTCMFRRHDRS